MKMTMKEQMRALLQNYVVNRNTLETIDVPAKATRGQMEALASLHGLSFRIDGEVRLIDECYAYAVRNGEVTTVAG